MRATMTKHTIDEMLVALHTMMYPHTEPTTHRWHLMAEVLQRQCYRDIDGVRMWHVGAYWLTTDELIDLVRESRRRAGEDHAAVRLRGKPIGMDWT